MMNPLLDARRQTDKLFDIVKPEALYDRPIPERHRIVFYIGHLEAFDWNLLSSTLGLSPFEPELARLFAFGIDPVGGGLPADSASDWPSLPVTLDYRRRVREKLDSLDEGSVDPQLLHVAQEHRLMHAETLAYMFHQLPLDRKISMPVARSVEGRSAASDMVSIPEGSVTLGLPRDGSEFGWDNEFDAHTLHVPGFTIDRYKVSNAGFLAFLLDGGYDHRSFWTDADWEWKSQHQVSHPVFWVRQSDGWRYRSMFDEIPLPLSWPVYVSHAEASAYCRWAGKALPSEAQWQRAAQKASQTAGQPNTNGSTQWDPSPVADHPSSRSIFGIEGMVGNGWEWTSTLFQPFEGFRPFPFYPGYSADFFDGKHYVMKGGSVLTAPCMLRPSFRNWFQPHYQYVYAGFRCIAAP